MGCAVVVGGASASERAAIERLFAERDRIFSRFRPGASSTASTTRPARRRACRRVFAEMLGLALEARRESGGLVDPTFGAELEAAGYDRDFSLLEDDPAAPATRASAGEPLRLDGTSVLVPAGMRLDLNGVVKGRTVDDALAADRRRRLRLGRRRPGRPGARSSVALPRGGTVRLVQRRARDERHRPPPLGRADDAAAPPDRPADAAGPPTRRGSRSPSADARASARTSPPRPPSCSATPGPRGSTRSACPARFVAAAGGVRVNRSWRRSAERRALRAPDLESRRLVRRAGGRRHRVPAPQRRRPARADDGGQEDVRPLAPVQRRGHPSLRRPARRQPSSRSTSSPSRSTPGFRSRSAPSSCPFTTRYRPIWVGLGVAAAELLLALAVTNHYRRRLPYTIWRRAHYLNFAVWTAASLHGIGSGTDRSSPWLLAMFAVAVSAVSAAIVWRVGRRSLGAARAPARRRRRPRRSAVRRRLSAAARSGSSRSPWNAARVERNQPTGQPPPSQRASVRPCLQPALPATLATTASTTTTTTTTTITTTTTTTKSA